MVKGILIPILVLGVLIFIHEFGHFLAAKLSGIYVERFSIGFGPKLFGFRKGETEYIISAFPLGGYVKLLGEDPEDTYDKSVEHRLFSSKPVLIKAIVVMAGPIANIIFACLIIFILNLTGIPRTLPEIGKVIKGTPAEKAGFMPNDIIIEINGNKIKTWSDIANVIRNNPEKLLKVKVKRKEKIIELKVKPETKEVKTIFGETKKIGVIGIVASGRTEIVKMNIYEAFISSIKRTAQITYITIIGIVKLIERVIPIESLGGPIMIVQMAKKQMQEGLINLLSFMAIISVNLGVINLLPIPILDGGHLLFFTIEAVRKKPLSIQTREIANRIGIFIIALIMFIAFYNDIVRIINRWH